jgi:hypothetical protein
MQNTNHVNVFAGTLVDRSQYSDAQVGRKASFKIGKKHVHVRDGTASLMRRLAASGRFAIAVWSSAMPANVDAMVDGSIPADVPIAFKLDRTHCVSAPKQGKSHATLKDLNTIWRHASLNPHRKWNEGNTVLIDDSPSKAARNPSNVLPVTTFELKPVVQGGGERAEDTVLDELCGMLLEWKDGVTAQQWCKTNYSRCVCFVLCNYST